MTGCAPPQTDFWRRSDAGNAGWYHKGDGDMHYYNGRWHLYDERERREYGERKRQERSRDWHKNWISR